MNDEPFQSLDTTAPKIDLFARVADKSIPPGHLTLWYTGGAGYVLKTSGALILIDPFVGPSNPPNWIRAIPPPFDPERVPRVDAVVMTHEHGDHADPAALGPIGRKTAAPAIGPASTMTRALEAGIAQERCRQLEWDESIDLGDVRLTAVKMDDPGANGCNGYVVEVGDIAVLHCGDSLYHGDFVNLAKRWSFDAICVSVGANPPGRTYYMDEVDAARAARDAGAKRLIPHHYDLWRGLTLDPTRVATAATWYCPEIEVVPARFLMPIEL